MSESNTDQDEAQFYSDLLRAFFDSANDAIFVLCDEMKFIICNKMTQQWLGFSENELTDHKKRIPITDLLGNPNSVDFFKSSFKRALASEDVFFETRIRPRNGKERWIELSMKRVDIEEGDMVIVVGRDITQRKKNMETIEHKSNYDQLTNLPNRIYLSRLIHADTKSFYNEKNLLTLLNIDIDRFKEINESFGHQAGDAVLQKIVHRLNRIIDFSSNELLARVEGDEFVLILPGIEIDKAQAVAIKIKNIISEPISIGENKISIDCSIGIANFPEHTQDKNDLMQYAESAMYTAKANKQGVGVYDPTVDKITTARHQLITDLRDAINTNQIIPYYQPIININKPDVIRVEVLARWPHKNQGFISPEIFIPLAEEVAMINKLTSNILSKSIEECSDFLKSGAIKKLSVNFSAYCMTDSKFIDEINSLLVKYSIPSEKIIFEITESVMMSNFDVAEKIINELHQSGITFAIDDFGTGYSSLLKLKQLPLSELKIDKSFIMEMIDNDNDAAISKASIQMAHALGLEVVAEGIENKATWDLLFSMGCDYGQGFWMAKPMPIKELIGWLKSEKNFN